MSIIEFPILYAPDPLKGRPLGGGQIFVGVPDLDPEIPANQKQLNIVQDDGAVVPVDQPFIVSFGGVPTYNGSTVRLDVDGNYSFKMLDKSGEQKYYVQNVLEDQTTPGGNQPSDLTQPYYFDTFAALEASTIVFPIGKALVTKGYYSVGDGGGADYIATAGSFIGITSANIAGGNHAKLQTKGFIDALQIGLTSTNIGQLCEDLVTELGVFAQLQLPAGTFTCDRSLKLDLKGRGSDKQGAPLSTKTTISMTNINEEIITIVKPNQILHDVALTFVLPTQDNWLYPNANGIRVPDGAALPFASFEHVTVFYCYAGLRTGGSIFGSTFKDFRVSRGHYAVYSDGTDHQTSMNGDIKANRCVNGFKLAKWEYSSLSLYTDHCGLFIDTPDINVPDGELPIMYDFNRCHLDIQYIGTENNGGMMFRLDNYSYITVTTMYAFNDPDQIWYKSIDGDDRDNEIPLSEQAWCSLVGGSLTINGLEMLQLEGGGRVSPQVADTPFLYKGSTAGALNKLTLISCNINMYPYKLIDAKANTYGSYGFDDLSLTVYSDDIELISSRFMTSHKTLEGIWYTASGGLALVAIDRYNNIASYLRTGYSVSRTIQKNTASNIAKFRLPLTAADTTGVNFKIKATILENVPSGNTNKAYTAEAYGTNKFSPVINGVLESNGINITHSGAYVDITPTVSSILKDCLLTVEIFSDKYCWGVVPGDGGREKYLFDYRSLVTDLV